MAFLKTVGSPTTVTANKDLEEYLLMGDGKERRRRAKDAGEPQEVIEHYLAEGHYGSEVGGRCRAYAHSPWIISPEPEGWAEEMTGTRRSWCKDVGRRYYHFVISPDPVDHVSVEECRDVAVEWATRMYPDAQWVVIVHDDNANHITHAHVVVNSVLPETGYKVHRDNDMVVREARVVQEVCREHHLSEMKDLEEWRREYRQGFEKSSLRWDDPTFAERAMREEGRHSWKDDIRQAAVVAVRGCHGWDEFVDKMATMGFEVKEGRRGVVYTHPDTSGPYVRHALGTSLGGSWTKEGILDQMSTDFSDLSEATARTARRRKARQPEYHRERLTFEQAWPDGRPRPRASRPANLYEQLAKEGSAPGAQVRAVVAAIDTMGREGITGRRDVEERTAAVGQEVAELQAKAERLARTEARCAEVDARGEQVEAAERELFHLQVDTRIWTPKARARRNELTRTIAEGREWAEHELADAAGWLASEGMADVDVFARAAHLHLHYAEGLRDLVPELEKAQKRLVALQQASAVAAEHEPTRQELIDSLGVDGAFAPFARTGTAFEDGRRHRSIGRLGTYMTWEQWQARQDYREQRLQAELAEAWECEQEVHVMPSAGVGMPAPRVTHSSPTVPSHDGGRRR